MVTDDRGCGISVVVVSQPLRWLFPLVGASYPLSPTDTAGSMTGPSGKQGFENHETLKKIE